MDKPYADTVKAATATVAATAPAGNGLRAFSGLFDFKETVATSDIHVQFSPPAPGAVLAYDSTEAPASFTYVTVEPKPEL